MDASSLTSAVSSAADTGKAIQIMKDQDEVQFYTLVKMHLSFVLNFSVDEVDAPVSSEDKSNESARKMLPFPSKSKSKSSRSNAGDSVVLSHEGVCQAYQLIEFLSCEENLIQEGLFRKTGNLVRQQELRQALLSGSSVDFESGIYTAHDCASVLKTFLASLSEPLLTKALYPAHCQVADICPVGTPAEKLSTAHGRQMKALQLLFLLIPAENYQLLKDLLQLLYKVSEYHAHNKMTALNLGTLFAPHILCPRKMSPAELQTASGSMAEAVALMIENTPLLFRIPQELEIDIRAYLDKQPGTPDPGRRRRRHSCSDVESPQATTVFSFVDRQQSAADAERTDTDTALAGLYAHISSMPDSARRRKLIKQFNRESGAGTPTVATRTRTRSFGESLRKHLFFTAGRQRKLSKAGLGKRSSSEELLASPPSPPSQPRSTYRRTTEDEVNMCPTPSGAMPAIKQSLLTPTASSRITPKLTRSLRQVQREGVPRGEGVPPSLPGSARRSARTAEMTTFRAGRNNSMRRGQVPLRPVRLGAAPEPAGPASPISQKMDSASSSTRVQMLTPRNRRAVCLPSQSSLPAAAEGASPLVPPTLPLSPVQVQCLEDSPTAPKRARNAELSSPFRRYLLQRDILTADPVDLSLMEVTSPSPTSASVNRLLTGEATLSNSLMDCLDGANPDGATFAESPRPRFSSTTSSAAAAAWPGSAGSSADWASASVAAGSDWNLSTVEAGDRSAAASGQGGRQDTVEADGGSPAGAQAESAAVDAGTAAEEHTGSASVDTTAGDVCDDGYRSLTSSSSGASLPLPPASPQHRPPLTDLSNQATALVSASNQSTASVSTSNQSTASVSASNQSTYLAKTNSQLAVPITVCSESELVTSASSQSELYSGYSNLSASSTTSRDHSSRHLLDSSKFSSSALLGVSEEWTDAGASLPTEPPSDDGENQRRKTLTDRETNPMAHRKIGAPRKRRSVMFETHL